MPRIEHYAFGTITVDGKSYSADLIIFPDHIEPDWWRKSGHDLRSEDLRSVLDFAPELLIIGSGAMGVMKVKEKLKKEIEGKGIRVEVLKTAAAVERFNALSPGKKVVAALHLTC